MSELEQAQDSQRQGRASLFSFLRHTWKPKVEAIYCLVGLALALTAGAFPLLSYRGTRHEGYGILGVAVFFQTLALVCLLTRMDEDDA